MATSIATTSFPQGVALGRGAHQAGASTLIIGISALPHERSGPIRNVNLRRRGACLQGILWRVVAAAGVDDVSRQARAASGLGVPVRRREGRVAQGLRGAQWLIWAKTGIGGGR